MVMMDYEQLGRGNGTGCMNSHSTDERDNLYSKKSHFLEFVIIQWRKTS